MYLKRKIILTMVIVITLIGIIGFSHAKFTPTEITGISLHKYNSR